MTGYRLSPLRSSRFQVDEDVGTALIEVVVSGNNLQDIDVSVSADGGSALLGEDFSAPPDVVTIPAGQHSAVIPVPIIADGLPETDEGLTLTLSDPIHANLGEPRTTTLTIVGDIPQPRFGLSPAAVSIDEHLGPVSLQLVLDSQQTGAVSARVTTVGVEAQSNVDFVAFDQVVTLEPGQTSVPITVQLVDDDVYEAAESFRVVLSDPLGGPGLSSAWESVVTLYPSDWPPFVYLADGGAGTAHYTGFETVGEVIIPVRLSAASEVPARVDFATTAGTATAGEDYVHTSGSLVFAPGVTEREIVVPILADGIDDDGETFSIDLSDPEDCVLDDGPLARSGVVHLVDGQPEVSFVRSEPYRDGGRLRSIRGGPVGAEWRRCGGDVPSDFPGPPTSSGDFWASTGVVQFAPGETRAWTPSIRARTDQMVEDEEFFTVELSQPVYALLGAQPTTEVRIVDRDTYQAFALDAVHVEHDLVHLTWRQTPYIHGDQRDIDRLGAVARETLMLEANGS